MYKGDTEPLAIKKFENFKEYLTLYPEYTCVFVGDNGQGDVRCGEMILAEKEYTQNIERIYIHQIQPLHLTYAKEERTKKIQDKGSKICYFHTYIDAALDAYRNNLILPIGLRRIMEV
jgi:phosphatidate phosphatase APP1